MGKGVCFIQHLGKNIKFNFLDTVRFLILHYDGSVEILRYAHYFILSFQQWFWRLFCLVKQGGKFGLLSSFIFKTLHIYIIQVFNRKVLISSLFPNSPQTYCNNITVMNIQIGASEDFQRVVSEMYEMLQAPTCILAYGNNFERSSLW